jgi:Tfp pilus assembly protein PilO
MIATALGYYRGLVFRPAVVVAIMFVVMVVCMAWRGGWAGPDEEYANLAEA